MLAVLGRTDGVKEACAALLAAASARKQVRSIVVKLATHFILQKEQLSIADRLRSFFSLPVIRLIDLIPIEIFNV